MMSVSRRHRRHLSLVVAAGVVAAVCTAPVTGAKPACTDIAPMTMLCESPGHARITTTPPARDSGPQYGWPLGGVVIGFL